MEEYKDFHGKHVGLITDGRVSNSSNWQQAGSLQLEGMLESETDTLLILRDLKTVNYRNAEPAFKSPAGTVNKSYIVSLYQLEE